MKWCETEPAPGVKKIGLERALRRFPRINPFIGTLPNKKNVSESKWDQKKIKESDHIPKHDKNTHPKTYNPPRITRVAPTGGDVKSTPHKNNNSNSPVKPTLSLRVDTETRSMPRTPKKRRYK